MYAFGLPVFRHMVCLIASSMRGTPRRNESTIGHFPRLRQWPSTVCQLLRLWCAADSCSPTMPFAVNCSRVGWDPNRWWHHISWLAGELYFAITFTFAFDFKLSFDAERTNRFCDEDIWCEWRAPASAAAGCYDCLIHDSIIQGQHPIFSNCMPIRSNVP